MTTATITISKALSVVKYISEKQAEVSTTQLSNLGNVISGLDVVTLTGLATDKKIEKYSQVLISAGFNMSCINWKENAGFQGKEVMNFNILFSK